MFLSLKQLSLIFFFIGSVANELRFEFLNISVVLLILDIVFFIGMVLTLITIYIENESNFKLLQEKRSLVLWVMTIAFT